jgi:hypothetical protein
MISSLDDIDSAVHDFVQLKKRIGDVTRPVVIGQGVPEGRVKSQRKISQLEKAMFRKDIR